MNWTSSPHDGFAQGGRDYRRIKVKGFQDVPLILRGGEVRDRPTFGVNGFLKIIFDRVPKNLRGGIGVLEDSIVVLFPSVPKNKARGKHPDLVEEGLLSKGESIQCFRGSVMFPFTLLVRLKTSTT